MGKSKWSVILLLVLGILFLASAVGAVVIDWEWWAFLLILSGMAFVVGLILFVAQRVLAAARS
jgi:hypothetical protein